MKKSSPSSFEKNSGSEKIHHIATSLGGSHVNNHNNNNPVIIHKPPPVRPTKKTIIVPPLQTCKINNNNKDCHRPPSTDFISPTSPTSSAKMTIIITPPSSSKGDANRQTETPSPLKDDLYLKQQTGMFASSTKVDILKTSPLLISRDMVGTSKDMTGISRDMTEISKDTKQISRSTSDSEQIINNRLTTHVAHTFPPAKTRKLDLTFTNSNNTNTQTTTITKPEKSTIIKPNLRFQLETALEIFMGNIISCTVEEHPNEEHIYDEQFKQFLSSQLRLFLQYLINTHREEHSRKCNRSEIKKDDYNEVLQEDEIPLYTEVQCGSTPSPLQFAL